MYVYYAQTLSIFWRKRSGSYAFHSGFLLGLFFDSEGGRNMFLWDAGWLSTDYVDGVVQDHSCGNLNSYSNRGDTSELPEANNIIALEMHVVTMWTEFSWFTTE
jgi:hypothetical protein